MEDPTDDDPLLRLIESVTLDVLTRLGDDPKARFRFFKGLVAMAHQKKSTQERTSIGH